MLSHFIYEWEQTRQLHVNLVLQFCLVRLISMFVETIKNSSPKFYVKTTCVINFENESFQIIHCYLLCDIQKVSESLIQIVSREEKATT